MIHPKENVINTPTHPTHYHKNGIDVIGFAEMQLPAEQLIGFCRINVLKYITRYDRKGTPLEDLEKAKDYLEKLISLEGANHENKAEQSYEELKRC